MRGTKKLTYIVFGVLAAVALIVFIIGGILSGWDFMAWLDGGDAMWAVFLIIIFAFVVAAMFVSSWIHRKWCLLGLIKK